MKFKTFFIIPTEDFKKTEQRLLVVTMPDLEAMENINEPEYKVQIPDFMFDELKDTEPQFRTSDPMKDLVHSFNSSISGCFAERELTHKFKKTQTSKSLGVLKDYIYKLTCHITNKHSLETTSMKKKIFIRFVNNGRHTRNDLNGAYQGFNVSQSFNFFTGYEVMTKQFSSLMDRKIEKHYISKILYTSGSIAKLDTGFKERDDIFLTLLGNGQSMKSFEETYSIVDWSQEREDFCKKIQDSFINIGKELSEFLTNISEEKFNALMANSIKLLNS